MAAPQKHRACNRPWRPFATRLATESGGLATNFPCDKPNEEYGTLHGGPRQGFVTEGPRQRYVTEGGGGDPDKPPFRVTAMYIYIYMYTDANVSIYATSRRACKYNGLTAQLPRVRACGNPSYIRGDVTAESDIST